MGTGFQVYISGKIGASGIGLLQLVMSVGGLAMVAGMAGVRTASMYLSAEELGRKKPENVVWILSGCFLYSICFSGIIAALLFYFAPEIAVNWIGECRTTEALRLFATFLPVSCLTGIMCGYFTAANRIGTLAAVEIMEQVCAMVITIAFLSFWAGQDAARACQSIILGSCIGSCITLIVLVFLRCREKVHRSQPIPVMGRLIQTALPLGIADVVKSGINTTENLMVPKRLALNSMTGNPLAAFGMISGMVFPVLMFPACILYGLAELLIPELARCTAAGSKQRIQYLVKRTLKAALLYGLLCGGLMILIADPLCCKLYDNPVAGSYLKGYALLIPMLYCDALTDAMTKGLGQQKACVRYNIITSAMDVVFLYLLLPKYGMAGYYCSFFLTHLLNFSLSLRRLLKISKVSIPFYCPALACCASLVAVQGSLHISGFIGQCSAYIMLLSSLLYLFRIVGREDFRWIKGLVRIKK